MKLRHHACAFLLAAAFAGAHAQGAAPVTPAAPASLLAQALALSDGVQPQVVEWRRHIHQNPELAYQETGTAK